MQEERTSRTAQRAEKGHEGRGGEHMGPWLEQFQRKLSAAFWLKHMRRTFFQLEQMKAWYKVGRHMAYSGKDVDHLDRIMGLGLGGGQRSWESRVTPEGSMPCVRRYGL